MEATTTTTRYAEIASEFSRRFGSEPDFIVRAPGRVNIIGEHIDYMGYGVLPMAIEREVVICGAVQSDVSDGSVTIEINNTDPERFTSRTVTHSTAADTVAATDVLDASHHWSNYLLCGYLGVVSHQKSRSCSMKLLVHGTVPMGSGLSSSSALVCASALATARANGWVIPPTTLADIACHSERFVGVEGGGMDQAIACLATAGVAKFIEFYPLRETSVRIPSGVTFVVSNSLVESHKYVTAAANYNLRVLECRLGCAIVGKNLGVSGWERPMRYSELQAALDNRSLEEMSRTVEQHLNQQPYTLQQIAEVLSIDETEVVSRYFRTQSGSVIAVAAGSMFELRKRAVHVFNEAKRVIDFKDTCDQFAASDGSQWSECVSRLGALMDESHASCRDLYAVSCPELDRLTEIAKRAGALGSRLTGAGWGGCTVSMVRDEDVDSFCETLWREYFVNSLKRQPDAPASDRNSVLFASKPAAGAAILK